MTTNEILQFLFDIYVSAYECLLGALEMGYNVDGYLVVDEKTLIHPWNFKGQFKYYKAVH